MDAKILHPSELKDLFDKEVATVLAGSWLDFWDSTSPTKLFFTFKSTAVLPFPLPIGNKKYGLSSLTDGRSDAQDKRLLWQRWRDEFIHQQRENIYFKTGWMIHYLQQALAHPPASAPVLATEEVLQAWFEELRDVSLADFSERVIGLDDAKLFLQSYADRQAKSISMPKAEIHEPWMDDPQEVANLFYKLADQERIKRLYPKLYARQKEKEREAMLHDPVGIIGLIEDILTVGFPQALEDVKKRHPKKAIQYLDIIQEAIQNILTPPLPRHPEIDLFVEQERDVLNDYIQETIAFKKKIESPTSPIPPPDNINKHDIAFNPAVEDSLAEGFGGLIVKGYRAILLPFLKEKYAAAKKGEFAFMAFALYKTGTISDDNIFRFQDLYDALSEMFGAERLGAYSHLGKVIRRLQKEEDRTNKDNHSLQPHLDRINSHIEKVKKTSS